MEPTPTYERFVREDPKSNDPRERAYLLELAILLDVIRELPPTSHDWPFVLEPPTLPLLYPTDPGYIGYVEETAEKVVAWHTYSLHKRGRISYWWLKIAWWCAWPRYAQRNQS